MGPAILPSRLPACAVSHPELSLPKALDRLGPLDTPEGEVSWSRSFPMASESLEFSACLGRSGPRLEARVIQTDPRSTQDIFMAAWLARQGGWVFEGAQLDGVPQSEPQAVAVFEDYVQALGATPTMAPARRAPGM